MSPLAITTPVPLPNSSCGAHMYAQGFGTWQGRPEEVKDAVINAIKAGYRLIDCARIYKNQSAVGEGISQCISEGIVKREELFVVSKVWNTDHAPAYVAASTRLTLKELGLAYLDLLLIHWPCAWPNPTPVDKLEGQTEWMVIDPATGGNVDAKVPIIDTYRAMEDLVAAGLVRDIGVSNFTIAEVEALFAAADNNNDTDNNNNKGLRYKPVVNQVEAHPALPQEALRAHCEGRGMRLMAYCPLGIGMGGGEGEGLIYDPALVQIAQTHGFPSAAALCLQWSSQQGFICLSKSVTPSRIAANAKTPFGGISAACLEALKAYGAANPLRVCNPGIFRPIPGPFFTE